MVLRDVLISRGWLWSGELPHTGEVGSWGAVCARRGTTRMIRVHVLNMIKLVRPAVELVRMLVNL